MDGIVELVAYVCPVVYVLAVVVYITLFQTGKDRILLLDPLQAAVVVALVYLQVAHKIVQRSVDDMLFVGVVELGDIEYHRVHLRQVELELVIQEGGVGGVKDKPSGVDATVKVDVAILVHHQVACVWIYHHLLAVA